MPNAAPSPQPSTPPPSECVLYVRERGPGWASRYHVTNPWRPGHADPSPFANVRYPNQVFLWVSVGGQSAQITQANWKDHFFWNTDAGRAGWDFSNYGADAPSGQGLWAPDPCNRNYGGYPSCMSRYSLPPATFTFHGATFNLYGPAPAGDTRPTLGGDCQLIPGLQVSPLAFDFKGKGVKFTEAGSNVVFDLGEGAHPYSWIANGDDVAFLALDRNENGKVDNLSELFGNTPARSGVQPASLNSAVAESDPNGFAALAKLDANGDKIIDQQDPAYSKLLLWFDKNGNGKTDIGELTKLHDSGIRSIDLAYTETVEFLDKAGNLAKQKSTATLADGKKLNVYDLWLTAAGEKSVRSDADGKPEIASVPAPGDPRYANVFGEFKHSLALDGWKEGEFKYSQGTIEALRDGNGKILKYHASWKQPSNECQANVFLSPDWKVLSSRVECNTL